MDALSITGSASAASASSLLDTRQAERDAAAGRDAEAAEAFEHLFARIFVQELRRALPEGPFGSGAGADVYEGWFDEHLGDALVERDALGLSGLIKTGLARSAAARAQAEQGATT